METQNFNQGVDTKTYEMKKAESNNDYSMNEAYNKYEIQQKFDSNKVEKLNEFKERLKQFNEVESLEEALELAKKILPVKNEITRFNVGEGKCTIVNRKDNFRISLDTETEFVSYDFV